ncbi:MAG: DUF488 domain-containing protein [Anaerolineae bacterium]
MTAHGHGAGDTGTGTESVVIYTIGHGHHPLEDFLRLLAMHHVQALADVRSQPYSRWAPQYNRETLARSLEQAGLAYYYVGDSLGGRPADPSLYEPGQERPDYCLMSRTPAYLAGIGLLLALAGQKQVALMCGESDYRQCHRHLLIARTLLEQGARVLHIQPDGSIVEEGSEPTQLSLFG